MTLFRRSLTAFVVVAALATIASPTCAEDRSQLDGRKTLADRAAQSSTHAGATNPEEVQLQRCRQIIREWTLRDQRLGVDELGRPLR